MRRFSSGTNITVFVLFFGLALLEALQTGNIVSSLFWVLVGLMFLGADLVNRRQRPR